MELFFQLKNKWLSGLQWSKMVQVSRPWLKSPRLHEIPCTENVSRVYKDLFDWHMA